MAGGNDDASVESEEFPVEEPPQEEQKAFRPQSLIEPVSQFAPPEIRKLIREWGDATIVKVGVCRVPITSAIQKVGNLLSFGKLDQAKKSMGYSDLFHLYLVLTLEKPDGQVQEIYLEKDDKVKYRVFTDSKRTEKADCILAGHNTGVTVSEMFSKAEKMFGRNRLWEYNLANCNCQRYVRDLLIALGISNKRIDDFVMQEPDKLLPKYLLFGAKAVTDLANKMQSFMKGKGA